MDVIQPDAINYKVSVRTSDLSSNTSVKLKKVEPQKFLIHSFECQEQAAYIRNRVIESIEQNNTAMVAFRYLQSKKGGVNVTFEAIFYSLLSVLCLTYSILFGKEILPAIGLVLAVPQVIINIRNSLLYKETKEIACAFLQEKLDERTCEKIKSLNYSVSDCETLKKMLLDSNINVNDLEKKLIRKNQRKNQTSINLST